MYMYVYQLRHANASQLYIIKFIYMNCMYQDSPNQNTHSNVEVYLFMTFVAVFADRRCSNRTQGPLQGLSPNA